jgi:hypothetical protein
MMGIAALHPSYELLPERRLAPNAAPARRDLHPARCAISRAATPHRYASLHILRLDATEPVMEFAARSN